MLYKKPLAIFIMGVSGVGKTTIGTLLSKEFSIPYFDGDDFHPKENVDKMSQGKSLNDEDRYGWLVSLNKLAKEEINKTGCVIACSALKEKYRDILMHDIELNVKWIFLNGSFEQVMARLNTRKNHYMPSSLLESQFETLEYPLEALKIDITKSPNEIIKIINNEVLNKSEFGLIGLGVMGKSLSRNLASSGFKISLFNRHVTGKEENIAMNFKNKFAELNSSMAFDNLENFVLSIQKPRKIMLMVNSGKTVDVVIKNLIPFLSKDDVIIDGGNSHYKDTERRINYLEKKGLHFIGAGVSGGEEGALIGPSIMPGGVKKAYRLVRPFLENIAGKDKNNNPCCTYIGKNGSGHFIKMVHNGMEYVEMQILAEVYLIFKSIGYDPGEIANILEGWKQTTNSYLLEITIEILRKKEDDLWLIDSILDKASDKGTGNWTTIATAELGVPSTMIVSALFTRFVSSYKNEREELSGIYKKSNISPEISGKEILQAYQLSRIINHHQGFELLQKASETYDWNLNLSEIARIWTNGCIIRSSLMEKLVDVLCESHNILLNKEIIDQVKGFRTSLNTVVSQCILAQLEITSLSEATNYLNGYTTSRSSANIIQAQRDYFGAHTYQRINDPLGKFYHTNWKNITHD